MQVFTEFQKKIIYWSLICSFKEEYRSRHAAYFLRKDKKDVIYMLRNYIILIRYFKG